MSSFFVSIFGLLAQDSPGRAACTAKGCCRHAETVCLCYQNVLKEFFQLSVVPPLLLAAGVGLLLPVFDDENVLLLKYNQFRIPHARDKQVEDTQDQSIKGCSHKELDEERYQQ